MASDSVKVGIGLDLDEISKDLNRFENQISGTAKKIQKSLNASGGTNNVLSDLQVDANKVDKRVKEISKTLSQMSATAKKPALVNWEKEAASLEKKITAVQDRMSVMKAPNEGEAPSKPWRRAAEELEQYTLRLNTVRGLMASYEKRAANQGWSTTYNQFETEEAQELLRELEALKTEHGLITKAINDEIGAYETLGDTTSEESLVRPFESLNEELTHLSNGITYTQKQLDAWDDKLLPDGATFSIISDRDIRTIKLFIDEVENYKKLLSDLTTQAESSKFGMSPKENMMVAASLSNIAEQLQVAEAYASSFQDAITGIDPALIKSANTVTELQSLYQQSAENFRKAQEGGGSQEQLQAIREQSQAIKAKLNEVREAAISTQRGIKENTVQIPDIINYDNPANIKEIVLDLARIKDKMKELESSGKGLGDADYDKLVVKSKAAQDAIGNYKNSLLGAKKEEKGTGKDASNGLNNTQKSANGTVESLAKVVAVLKKVGAAIGKTVVNFGKLVLAMAGFRRNAHAATTAHDKFRKSLKHGFGLILKYAIGVRSVYFLIRKLRGALTEGFENMAKFNDGNNEFNKSMTELQTSLLYVKNAWASAFAPVINYVMPVITTLIDLIAQLGNALGQLFGKLLGNSSVLNAVRVRAQDYAESLDGTSKAAGGAGQAADKLKDKLAPFDDLNVLGTDDSSDRKGGGGGGGIDSYVPDPNEMFMNVEPKNLFNKIMDPIKKAFEEGDFTSLGLLIGNKFNEAFDLINWDEIRRKLSKGIFRLSEVLNGFVDSGAISNFGSTIHEALMTAVSGIEDFLVSFDFEGAGIETGEFWNKILNPGAIDSIYIGITLSNAINKGMSYLNSMVSTINWSGIGSDLGVGVTELLRGIDWSKISGTASKIITGGLGLVSSFIQEIDARDIVQAVVGLLKGIDVGGIFAGILAVAGDLLGLLLELVGATVDAALDGISAIFKLLGLDCIAGLFDGLGNGLYVATALIREFFTTYVINPIKKLFGIHSPSTLFADFGKMMIQGLINGVLEIKDRVTAPFLLIYSKIKGVFDSLIEKIVDIWTGLKESLKTPLNAVIDLFNSFMNFVISGLNTLINAANNLSFDIYDLKGKKHTVGFNLSTIPVPQITPLAKGGVIPPNNEFLALLGDQKQGTNIEAPLDTIVEAFKSVVGNLTVQNSGSSVMQVDGQTFARLMTPYVVSELDRRGYNVAIMEGK